MSRDGEPVREDLRSDTIAAMTLRALALWTCGLVALGACRDDFNANDGGDAEGDTGDADTGDTGNGDGDGDGDNMLGNASFEDWLDGGVQVWTSDVGTLTRSEVAFDGDYSLEFSGQDYASISQPVSVGLPLPAGTCVRLGAALQWVSGAGTAPGVLLNVTYEDDTEEPLGAGLSWVADGQWYESSALIEVPQTAKSITVSIGGTTAAPMTYLIDATLMRVESCG